MSLTCDSQHARCIVLIFFNKKMNSSLLLLANDKVCKAKITSLVEHSDLKPNCASITRFLDLHTQYATQSLTGARLKFY